MTSVGINTSDRLLASTAFLIIRRAFCTQPPTERKCFKLANFTAPEALAFLEICERDDGTNGLADTTIVVASDAPDAFPQQYRAAQNETITTYRNDIKPGHGLIYIETKVESDSQGLKNLFTLRDINFLDGSFDNEQFSVSRELIKGAIHAVDDSAGSASGLLVDRCADVLDGLRNGGMAVSVRKFASFALAVASKRHEAGRVLDSGQIDAIVGQNLIALDLFPDEHWRKATSAPIISRRLTQNILHAELASSQSSDLDQDKLIEQCKRTVFRDPEGENFSGADQIKWRSFCESYSKNPISETRRQIPYWIFEQLFSRDVKGLPLGERVEEEIDEAAPDRLYEFTALDVKGGLSRRFAEDARRFMETEPDEDGLSPLRDQLSKLTRRMIEKVAYPTPEQFDNPLIKIAEIAEQLRRRGTGNGQVRNLILKPGRNADASLASVGLFAFLYGPTLASVCEASRFTTDGMVLKVDSTFTRIVPPPTLITSDDEPGDGNEDLNINWGPVPVEFVLVDPTTGEELDSEQNLEWFPAAIDRLALLWLMTSAEDRPRPGDQLKLSGHQSADGWVGDIVARTEPLNSCISAPLKDDVVAKDVIADLIENAEGFHAKCRSDGVSTTILHDLYDRWNELLATTKDSFIPQGAPDPCIDAFLRHECILGADGESMLMLASHPIRARWIACYLKKSEELVISALNGDLPLNSQNETLYLRWIAKLSPHQSPAVHVAPNGSPLLATQETGWTEEYAPLRQTNLGDLSESIASASLVEIVKQVTTYLEAHPYKRDGLEILIVSPSAPKLPAEIAELIRKGEWRDARLTIHFASPRALWERATAFFEEVPSENRLTGKDALFPPLQLTFHELLDDGYIPASLLHLDVDIAVVPQFLQDDVSIQEHTAPASEETGNFDPLLDQPTFIYGGSQGGVISVAQRPRSPDTALSNWSTLVVRQHRMGPVSKEQPQNTDLFELRINFQNAARLFSFLHERSHWVITLERYITREQIEALENRPEILTVKHGVGPGASFTLIVSSNIGRKFIINRLERKLANIVKSSGETENALAVNRELAANIYDETRQIAPWLALKAMGISRVSEEILGLMVGRRMLEQEFPVRIEKGLSAWISFDDHQEWFGEENATRADLCRITFDQTDDGLIVDLVVLESKLRASGYEPHGVTQVASTLALLADTMPMPENEGNPVRVDAPIWRESILSAIEALNPDAIEIVNMPEFSDDPVHQIPGGIRSSFRDGQFRLRSFAGIYSICAYTQSGTLIIKSADDDPRIRIAKSFGADLLALVTRKRGTSPDIAGVPTPPNGGGVVSSEEVESWGAEAESGRKRTGTYETLVEPTDTKPESDHANNGSQENLEPEPTSARMRKLTDNELENRYQLILDTYGEFDIPVHPPENRDELFVEGPASVLYRIERGRGVAPERIMQQAATLKLNLKLLEEQEVRFSTDRGRITIDVPKSEEDRFFVKAAELWQHWNRPEDHLSVPLGLDRYGEPVSLDFSSSNCPHLLIGGTTGSGKSEALNTILAGLVTYYKPDELRLLLVDPKGTELEHYSGSKHLKGDIGWDADDTLVLLDKAIAEMDRRYQEFKAVRKRSLPEFNAQAASEDRIPWWFIVLDEYADLTSEKEAKKAIEDRLKRLAQKARAAGIHLVIATQKPAAEVISTNLRSNLPAQLALRVKSSTESHVVMDESGAETLNGMGDAFLKCEGKLTRIQCAKV
jgi:DNA segregation ATPase FtsK/SpoIIIE, S-DNA-T family